MKKSESGRLIASSRCPWWYRCPQPRGSGDSTVPEWARKIWSPYHEVGRERNSHRLNLNMNSEILIFLICSILRKPCIRNEGAVWELYGDLVIMRIAFFVELLDG